MSKPGSLARSRLRRRMEGGIQTTWIALEGGCRRRVHVARRVVDLRGEISELGGGHWRHRTRAQGGGRC
jgi:hypothetical protein